MLCDLTKEEKDKAMNSLVLKKEMALSKPEHVLMEALKEHILIKTKLPVQQ